MILERFIKLLINKCKIQRYVEKKIDVYSGANLMKEIK